MTMNPIPRQKKVPLDYTPKQLAQVKNGMPVRDFVRLYGDTTRTRSLYHKLKNMKTLGQVEDTQYGSITTKDKSDVFSSRTLGGKFVRVNDEVYRRGQVLLELYDGQPKLLRSALIQTLITREYITRVNRGWYQITDIGKDYLETILDENRGFSTLYKKSYPKDQCYYAQTEHWTRKRMGLGDVKSQFRPNTTDNQNQVVSKATPQKLPRKTLWEKILSVIPQITIKVQRA